MRPFDPGPVRDRVLLVGIDGLLWDVVDAVTAPTLTSLAEQGARHTMQMQVPTLSGPGWASILTGTDHATHAVVDNSFVGHRLHHCPDLLSRAFYADQSTRTFAAAGWPPLVDPAGLGPVIHERREQQFAGLHRVVVRDGETYGYPRADAEVVDFADLALRQQDTFDVGFVYLCTVDDTGHLHGADGPAYLAAVTLVDALVARLAARVRRRAAAGERWLFVVTTDHGHRPGGGHGGGTPAERASFVLAAGMGREGVDWPDQVQPHQLVDLLLAERARQGTAITS